MTRETLIAFARESAPGSQIIVRREDLLALIQGENPDGRSEAREPCARSSTEATSSLLPLKRWARERGVSERTARRWIKAGALTGVRKLPGRGGFQIPVDAGTPVASEATKANTSCTVAAKPRARRPLPEEIEL
jgi:hypothetical protein